MIHIVEIDLGKNSQFFVEITIKTRPPICECDQLTFPGLITYCEFQ